MRAASSADTTPPFDSIISTAPPKPSVDSHFCSSSRYGPITGIVAALQAVVTIRGYSRICGDTSAEMHTGTAELGAQVLGDAPLVGAVDVGVEQADADRLDVGGARSRRCSAARSASVGSAISTTPSAAVRSAISNVRSRGIGGAGNSICRSYMS